MNVNIMTMFNYHKRKLKISITIIISSKHHCSFYIKSLIDGIKLNIGEHKCGPKSPVEIDFKKKAEGIK